MTSLKFTLFPLVLFACCIEVSYSQCTTKSTILENARIIDGTGSDPKDGWDIIICDDKIFEIGQNLSVPDDANRIKVSGLTILPGLIDMHGHLFVGMGSFERSGNQQAYLNLFLAGGVTTIYSPGEYDAEGTLILQEKINFRLLSGPDILTAGPYFDHAPSQIVWINGVRSVEELQTQFNEWKYKISGVKAYTSITEEELRKLIELADQYNLPVTGHLGSVTAAKAVAMGIDGIEHGILGMPEFFECDFEPGSTACQDTEFDLTDPAVESLIQNILENNVYITPTIVTLKAMLADSEPIAEWKQYISKDALKYLPVVERMIASNKNMQDCIPNLLSKQFRFIKEISDRGGLIVTGTDPIIPMITPGYGLHREMELLVEAGLSPMGAIQAATLNGAKALRKDAELGSIEIGKLANLVIVQGDPSQTIEDIGNTIMIMKRGKMYNPDKLRASVLGEIGKESK